MSQSNKPSLVERLQALRARFAAPFQCEPKGLKAVLKVEAMEDRSLPSTVGGSVWFDTNSNGAQDAGEAVAAGVGVTLSPLSGSPVSTTTDAGGGFSFTGIGSGSYAVAVSAPTGYSATGPTGIYVGGADTSFGVGLVGSGVGSASASGSASVGDGGSGSGSASGSGSSSGSGSASGSGSGSSTGSGSGLTSGSGSVSGSGSSSASVGGLVWFDANPNLAFDCIENTAAGVGVTLTSSGGSVLTTVTDQSGSYVFGAVAPGEYTLTFAAPTGYSFDTPVGGQVGISVGSSAVSVGAGLVDSGSGSGSGTGSGSGSGSMAGSGSGALPIIEVQKLADAYEDGRDGWIRFTRTGDLSQPLAIAFAVTGTATPSSDYTDVGTTVIIPANDATFDLAAVALDDAVADPGESFTLTLQPSEAYGIGMHTSAIVMVVDDDSAIVSITKTADAMEGGSPGAFQFRRVGDASSVLTVTYSVSGTVSSSDYSPLTASVTFPAGSASVDVAVFPVNDTIAENTEELTLTIEASSFYQIDPVAEAATAFIIDDDTNGANGLIAGVVWADNGDGIRQSNELLQSGSVVELLDDDGRNLFATITADDGTYQFRGLPEGNYLVVFGPSLGWGFTLPNQGVDESVDSDVDSEVGTAARVTLGDGTQSITSVDAGFVSTLPGAAADNDIKIRIVDRKGKDLNAGGLRVAKWGQTADSGAWTPSFEADPKDAKEFGYKRVPRLLEPDALKQDFIDKDDDRFIIMVQDKASYENNVAKITVKLSTVNEKGFEAYNDDATPVSLIKSGSAGWYFSDTQILVSNKVDDEYSDPAYLGKDDAAPGQEYKKGKDGAYTFNISDRTHRIALGGKLVAQYNPPQGEAVKAEGLVKADQKIKLNVTILNDVAGPGGKPIITKEAVEGDLARMREVFAQAGIRVEDAIQIKDPPKDVNLANGLDGYGTKADAQGKLILTPEEQALLGEGTYRTPTVNGKDDIEVYYVGLILPPLAGEVRWGEAFPAARVPDQKYANSVIIGARSWDTLPHEIVHVLGYYKHFDSDINLLDKRPVERVNLMIEGNRVLASNKDVNDSRRLTPDQVKTMTTTVASLIQ